MHETESYDGLLEPKHHIQQELCTTRPRYRQGRKLTAVKVYTINSESQHLFVYGVPKINLRTELKSMFSKLGQIVKCHVVENHKTELFTECYHMHYKTIQSARAAKRFLDNKSFYGGILHVCYAPEYETVDDTREKLLQRNKDVLTRLKPNETNSDAIPATSGIRNRKRKHPALEINEERLRNVDQSKLWDGIPEDIDPRIVPDKFCKVVSAAPVKHFQVNKVLPEYGPCLPTDEQIALCSENDSELNIPSVKNSSKSNGDAEIIKKWDVKSSTEKKIVFKK